MPGTVYLIKVGELYNIGSTSDLSKRMKKLRPTEIIISTEVKDANSIKARLYKRYRKSRMPDSEYFKLSEKQLADCQRQLGSKPHIALTTSEEFKISLSASILSSGILLFICLFLGVNIFLSSSISLLLGTLPMWILFFQGSFGGYEANDLPLFSTWRNRLKALFSACVMILFCYELFRIISPTNN